MSKEIGVRIGQNRIQQIEKSLKRAKDRENYDYMVKVIVVGDSGVGKTNIISRFCAKIGQEGTFKDYHVATIGVDFSTKIVQLEDARVKLQIWDTAGQQRFRTITETYYRGAAAIFMVYSVDSEESFLNISQWIEQVNARTSQSVKRVLVANKTDVEDDFDPQSCLDQPRKITRERGAALAQKHSMEYFEVSAKNNQGISEMFEQMTQQLHSNVKGTEVKNQASEMQMTITLNSKHSRVVKKIRKFGIEYKLKDEISQWQKYKQKICNC